VECNEGLEKGEEQNHSTIQRLTQTVVEQLLQGDMMRKTCLLLDCWGEGRKGNLNL